jgi:5-methylcytosine-specific restriction endonuclease McrA
MAQKKYRENNKEEIKEKRKLFYIKNREHISKISKEYYLKTLDKQRLRSTRYKELNKDKIRERGREYYSKMKNLGMVKPSNKLTAAKQALKSYKRRYMLSLVSSTSFNQEEWDYLKARTHGRCACCLKEAKLEVDHIIPLSKGGDNSIGNIQPLCKSCNCAKGGNVANYLIDLEERLSLFVEGLSANTQRSHIS